MLMVDFYVNYTWLTPRYFVQGKHRYYLMINVVMAVSFSILLHYWMDYSRVLFQPGGLMNRNPDGIDEFFFYLRDLINFGIFATAATCIALAQRWFWADNARKYAETARVRAEADRTEAELKSLRSQINPHFLLNTLNNIYALTAMDTFRAQNAIQQLSKMLRHMLYDNMLDSVSLQDEIQFLENYVNLMKIRLPESVDVTFKKNVPDADIRVAPLIFISLFENAFKHGVSLTEPSFIRILIKADLQPESGGKQLICSIENSYFPKPEQDRSGHGIGLEQVQRRLDLLYPDRYVWEKGTGPDNRTYYSKITIQL
ncbi:MAG: sensor histidine kinase [Prevotella sp.]|nr:sensor histidine kinase [Prevotella sp.]